MKKLLLLGLSLICAASCYTQTDTTQKASPWQLSGDLGLDLAFQSGNLQSSTIVGQLSPVLEGPNVQVTPYLQYMYSRYNQQVYQNDVFGELSADLWYKKRFFPNISGRYEATTLRAIKNRYSIGPGIAWRVVKTRKSDLVLLNAVLYHRTAFDLANRDFNFERFLYALTLRGSYQVWGDKLSFSHDLQYTPWRRSERTNHILRAIFSVGLPLSEHIAVNIDVDYVYETLVVRNRKKGNLTSAFGIAYSF
jgi:hypothetical protein